MRVGLTQALALMIKIFRLLIVVAVGLLLFAVFLPFDRPIQIDVDLNQPPPVWLVVSGAFLIVSLLLLVAAVALFIFRGWGRFLGASAGAAALIVAWLTAGSPLAQSLSLLANVLLALSMLTWLLALAVSYHPSVAPRFCHER